MATSGIRKSPYEPGLYFVDPEPGTTLQSIGQQQWQVLPGRAPAHVPTRPRPSRERDLLSARLLQLGTRYELLKVLGYGSFSAVCLALDKETGEKVRGRSSSPPLPHPPICTDTSTHAAHLPPPHPTHPNPTTPLPFPFFLFPSLPQVALKRIGDVLHSPEQAKRVLREICILRRLQHPNVIGIRDCFTRPSATGVRAAPAARAGPTAPMATPGASGAAPPARTGPTGRCCPRVRSCLQASAA
jgi:hypothetical protein